jgi:prepilin-type N-terminal cleavage/methylation domain-containing protein
MKTIKEKKNKVGVKTNKDGFTLVELLVTISIMALISASLFWNGRQFNDKLALSTTAQDVSLTIRSVQSYSSSVRESSGGTGQFSYGYGISFDMSDLKSVTLFTDKNSNKVYDLGDTLVDKSLLRNGVSIKSICATDSANVQSCSSSFKSLQITFIRPSLSATISTVDTSGFIRTSWVSGQIILSSQQGITKTISVNSFGQISIQ